jgi:putative ABC transport system ATP-binding protein
MAHEEMNKFVFSLQNVQKNYPNNPITFEKLNIPRGQMVGVLGTSGCGKTTLLNLLALIDNYDHGDIVYYPAEGAEKEIRYHEIRTNVNRKAEIRAGSFGYIFQSDELLNQFSVGHNVQLPFWLQQKELTPEYLEEQLKLVGPRGNHLDHWAFRNPADLSEGQRSRVALLRAFAGDPQVIFADEPTANLDKHIETEIMGLLVDWLKHGEGQRTILLSTHNIDLAAQYCSHFIIIRQKANAFIPDDNDPNTITTGVVHREVIEYQKQYDTDRTYQDLLELIFGSRRSTQGPKRIMDPTPTDKNNQSLWKVFWKLLRYDFWRHPRSKRNFFVTYLSPVLFIFAVLTLVWGGSYILGVRAGNDREYQAAIQNDLLWTTEIMGASSQIGGFSEQYGESLWRSVKGFSRWPVLAYQNGKQSVGGSSGLTRILGRTMEKDDPLLDAIEKSLIWPDLEEGRKGAIELFKAGKFGVIVSADMLVGSLQFSRDNWPRALAVRSDSATAFWLPILGVAKEIPAGDFIVSLPVHDAYIFEPFEKNYLHPSKLNLLVKKEVVNTEEALDRVSKVLTSAGLNITSINPKTVEGNFILQVRLDQSESQFGIWNKLESSWGDLGQYLSNFEIPMTFPSVHSSKDYIHWSVILNQSLSAVDSFIQVCYEKDLFIDTSVRTRLKSLNESHAIFDLMSRLLLITTLVLGLILLFTSTWFDSDKKTHSVGVMLGIGVGRKFLILAFTAQLILLIGAAILIYCLLDMAGVAGALGLNYAGFSTYWWLYCVGVSLVIPVGIMMIRYCLYRNEPAVLCQHRS